MIEKITFETIAKPEEIILDVVFIHGLKGDAKETWGKDDKFWPLWLAKDNPNIAVHTFGYPASWLRKLAKKELDVFEIAKAATEYLCANEIGTRPVVFIAHSLGGIVAKLIFLHCHESSDEQISAIAKRTVKILFLATPHTGTALASVAKSVISRITSAHIDILAGETTILNSINENYRKYEALSPQLSTVAYYEGYSLVGITLVVSRDQADPGISGTAPIGIPADHFKICKPDTKNDLIYVSVNRHVKQSVSNSLNSPELFDKKITIDCDDFSAKAEHDRRELFEKMKAANREHEYLYANRQQNKFARKYVQLGLQPATRDDYSIMLGEVEQRFQSQVYFPLICKGVDEETIRKAVQQEIIYPLSSSPIGSTIFSANKIQSAIYFLTEQCHIRWDPES